MENKTKRVFWGFFSLDYKAMEIYLENMAKDGWMLEKVGRFTAKFRAIEPQRIKFYVDVFKDGGPLSGEQHECMEDYKSLCEESGWHYITSQDYLQFFYAKENENPTPIQTDEVLEQNIVQSSLWKQEFFSVLVFFFALGVGMFTLYPVKYTNLLTFIGSIGTFVYPLLGIPMLFTGGYLLIWMLSARGNIKAGVAMERPSLTKARRRGMIFNGLSLGLGFFIIIALIGDIIYMPRISGIALMPAVVGVGIGLISRYIIKKRLNVPCRKR